MDALRQTKNSELVMTGALFFITMQAVILIVYGFWAMAISVAASMGLLTTLIALEVTE